MAGGFTTPELVAAVSNAGALGSLGAGYLQPQEIQNVLRRIKSLTNCPFNVNTFVEKVETIAQDISPVLEKLHCFWQEVSEEPFTPFISSLPSFEKQIDVLLAEKIPVFSFTFGTPPLELIRRFQQQGTLVFGTATTPEEAQELEEIGVDAIVCQGFESGGHRGNFSSQDPFLGLSALLALTKSRVTTPLIAAGGIMNGRGVRAALALGADAAQLGTAFLTTAESGAHPTYKQALLQKPARPTRISQAFTGKPARAIVNRFMEVLDLLQVPTYPVQHCLTAKLRALAAEKGRPDLMSLWAGQGYPLCQSISAVELIRQITQEIALPF